MDRFEIRLCGFGGQGVALAGKILGAAVSIYEEKNSVTTQSYGPESRGGASSCNVVMSDKEIDFPYLTDPDIFICLSKEAYFKHIDSLKENGILFYEEDLVPVDDRIEKAKHVFKLPATNIAEQELGKRIVANIVMLGFFAAINEQISSDSILKSVLRYVPKKYQELNKRAFKIGMRYGEEEKQHLEAKK
ncbi:MAG: 2-oxoacid:acceptor oxidoreductase family protein [Asgard group archaeon]|nr:2-oxoacid:acceptor oxidoreductase family protein [Asgard group archaeon]